MELERRVVRRMPRLVLGAVALGLAATLALGGCASDPEPAPGPAPREEIPEEGRLDPRYQPREPLEEPWYNTDYLFGMTRAVTNSTIHPGAQVPLLVLTIPFDIVFLPFTAIGGFF